MLFIRMYRVICHVQYNCSFSEIFNYRYNIYIFIWKRETVQNKILKNSKEGNTISRSLLFINK